MPGSPMGMKMIKRKQTKREKAKVLLADYLQFKAVKGLVKFAPVLGAITAAGVFAKKRRSSGTPSTA